LDVPDDANIVGASPSEQFDGYSFSAVRVDLSRGVFYLIRAN